MPVIDVGEQVAEADAPVDANNVNQLLERALRSEKGYKTIIKKLYRSRDVVVALCQAEVAARAFECPKFVCCDEGRKLAATFLCQESIWEQAWSKLECFIGSKTAAKEDVCRDYGEVVFHAWKSANEDGDEAHGTRVTKRFLEDNVMKNIVSHAILLKKNAERFYWMVEAFADDKSKKVREMHFRCTEPFVWRYLHARNAQVRYRNALLILRLYPLTPEEEDRIEDYKTRQHDAMHEWLTDDIVPLRAAAVHKVLFLMSVYWNLMPGEMIKNVMETIVNVLSRDVPTVRVAIYEGLEHLLPCGAARNIAMKSMESLMSIAIDDTNEKVRFAAFRLLQKLRGHKYIKLHRSVVGGAATGCVEPEHIMARLDIEPSRAVQVEIVRLLYPLYISSTKVDGAFNVGRAYRVFEGLARMNRRAALHFHRLIFTENMIKLEDAVLYLRSLMMTLATNLFGAHDLNSTTQSNIGVPADGGIPERPVDQQVLKTMLDCMIVLWVSMQTTLAKKDHAKDEAALQKIMAKFMSKLIKYEQENDSAMVMIDSALTIASFLPSEHKDSKDCRAFIRKALESEPDGTELFPHYLEAYATMDFDDLLEIVRKALDNLRKAIDNAVTSSQKDSDTASASSSTDSPPRKRPHVDKAKLIRPLRILDLLLASPVHQGKLVRDGVECLEAYCETLKRVCRKMDTILQDRTSLVGTEVMLVAYETYTVLSILSNKASSAEPNEGGDNLDDSDAVPQTIDLLEQELDWFWGSPDLGGHGFAKGLRGAPFQAVAKAFLRCVDLHLDSGPQSLQALEKLATVVQGVYDWVAQMSKDDCAMLRAQLMTTIGNSLDALKFIAGDTKPLAQRFQDVKESLVELDTTEVASHSVDSD
ncbi:Protein CAPG-2 [Aphelenchoides avenae]|nr:Protein CAPG-2 [Aphelenchus avenae]